MCCVSCALLQHMVPIYILLTTSELLVIVKRFILNTFPGSILLRPDHNSREVLRWDKQFFICLLPQFMYWKLVSDLPAPHYRSYREIKYYPDGIDLLHKITVTKNTSNLITRVTHVLSPASSVD